MYNIVCLHSLSHVTEGGRTIEACSSRADPVIYNEVDPALGLTIAAQDIIKEAQTTSLVRFLTAKAAPISRNVHYFVRPSVRPQIKN